MNRTVPTANLAETAAEKNRRRARGSKLRAIDKGTSYDIPGKLRKLVREIEGGKHGDVTDIVVAIRCVKNNKPDLNSIFTGRSNVETLHYMATWLARECQP